MTADTQLFFPDAAALEAFGESLAERLRTGDVLALSGDLGAGKTTLARGVLRGLGYDGDAPSPTFTIVQSYEPPEVRLSVWHVDLYRIDDPADAVELGLDEALGHAALLIEWPERLGDLLPTPTVSIRIEGAGEGEGRGGHAGAGEGAGEAGRRLTARFSQAWEGRWRAA